LGGWGKDGDFLKNGARNVARIRGQKADAGNESHELKGNRLVSRKSSHAPDLSFGSKEVRKKKSAEGKEGRM